MSHGFVSGQSPPIGELRGNHAVAAHKHDLAVPGAPALLWTGHSPQPLRREAARVVSPVLVAELAHGLVVPFGEGVPGLAHPGDHRDRGPVLPSPGQLLSGRVLQQAEQPELLAARVPR